MKTLLVTFAVLLFLLTLLSSFGGSIRVHEPYFEETPAVQPPATEEEKPMMASAPAPIATAPATPMMPSTVPEVPKIETYGEYQVPEPFEEESTIAPF